MSASLSCFSIVSWYDTYLRRSLSAVGLSSQTIEIDDQTTIDFWAPKPSPHPNPKPPLVLIQGFGPDALWQWRRQAAFLAGEFDVYVPNLVFFGRSTTRSSERSEIFQAESLGKLLQKLGIKRYSVMGTSYGGFVAYHMATMWPERIEKVVIASSGVNLTERDNADLVKRANVERIDEVLLPASAGQLRAALELALFGRPYYVPDFLLNDAIDKLYSRNRKEKMELLKGLTLGRNNEVNLSPLQQEVLIIWGDHDQIFPLQKATELKELLGEKVRLEVIKNAAHVPQIEQSGQFNNIVKKFLCGSSS